MKGKYLLFFTLSAFVIACSEQHQYDEMNDCAVQFADSYFNYKFAEALKQCSSESEKWVRFAASNVSDDDINILNAREKPAEAEAVESRFVNDTIGTVSLKVHNYLSSDSIGVRGKIVSTAYFQLDMKKTEGRWRVVLSSLPHRLKQGK